VLRSQAVSAANRLLAALPGGDLERFLAQCEPVQLRFADVLAEPGERISHVYFPTSSFISQIAPTNGRPGLEVGMIGNEGMLGISVILGIDVWPLYASVQGRGTALRIETRFFRRQLKQSPTLQRRLQRYLYVLIGQLARKATCTRFHLLEARLARWLLMAQDRAHGDEFHVTQELLAVMLGVRRVGVTKAAISLQDHKLIRYRRGDITILDRDRLRLSACDCYAADAAAYAEMLD